MDPRIQNLAKILVNYSVRVQPENWVIVRGNVVGLPLITEIYRAAIQVGGNPSVFLSADNLNKVYFQEAKEAQLKWISPYDSYQYKNADVIIDVQSTANTRNLAGIDLAKQKVHKSARQDLRHLVSQRSARGELRWVTTEFPCEAYAQEANMSLREYQDFVYQATMADKEDPISLWQGVYKTQQKYIDWLKGKEIVEVRGSNVDLRLSIKDRSFVNSAGLINMPDGEIFTGPVEDSVNGWVNISFPMLRDGYEIEGVELSFKDGKVVKAKASKNEAVLLNMLDTDDGSRYLGEFAIGTNYSIQNFTKNILYDEKMGGTIHMAVGLGYPETGSKNVSAIHWDFICDLRENGEIIVDGELFFKNGEFQI